MVVVIHKKRSLKRKTIKVRSVKCKIKRTNEGLNECMAQELTSPLQGWGYYVLITRGWSDHDYKCTVDRHTPPEMSKT